MFILAYDELHIIFKIINVQKQKSIADHPDSNYNKINTISNEFGYEMIDRRDKDNHKDKAIEISYR